MKVETGNEPKANDILIDSCICGCEAGIWKLTAYEVSLQHGKVLLVLEAWEVRCADGCRGSLVFKGKNGSCRLEVLTRRAVQQAEESQSGPDEEVT